MPYRTWQYPKLSKLTWSVIFRLLQLAGYSPNAESYKIIKERSKKCANHLVELAKTHDSVLFVGHGTLNWFIHKHLVSMGWVGPNKPTRKHWELGEYLYN
jgi:broad specificity phosphatase PhoE